MKLEATTNFRWCHVQSISKVFGRVSVTQPAWSVDVDLSDILKDLPRLQLMDKERERKEELEKREERKRMKEGNPESMTIQLLREVLEEMGEPYSKNWKKPQLIQRVRAAREKQNSTVYLTTSAATTTIATTATHGTGPRRDFETAKIISSSSQEQILAADGNSLLRQKHPMVVSVTALYYYDEKKERIICLLLDILFILDLISLYMDI